MGVVAHAFPRRLGGGHGHGHGAAEKPAAAEEKKAAVVEFDWHKPLDVAACRAQSFPANATVKFVWPNLHNVWAMPDKAAFDACDFAKAVDLGQVGGADGGHTTVDLKKHKAADGTAYLACQVGKHCPKGQKLAAALDGGAVDKACLMVAGAHDGHAHDHDHDDDDHGDDHDDHGHDHLDQGATSAEPLSAALLATAVLAASTALGLE